MAESKFRRLYTRKFIWENGIFVAFGEKDSPALESRGVEKAHLRCFHVGGRDGDGIPVVGGVGESDRSVVDGNDVVFQCKGSMYFENFSERHALINADWVCPAVLGVVRDSDADLLRHRVLLGWNYCDGLPLSVELALLELLSFCEVVLRRY